MLLGSAFGQWLEPVGVVRDTVLVGPLLHALGNLVGNRAVEFSTVVDYVDEFLINVARQVLVHLRTVEYFLTEELRRALGRSDYFDGPFFRGLLNCIKS